ncbi:unnamed protein product [Rotaria sp. Silwood1]|nr:unnamed protein product [Rotaria sp. Silwood1]
MATEGLINILERTVTGSQADLENARNFLAKAAEQNLSELLKQLSDILITATNNPTARAQAALQLKNALYSREDTLKQHYQERWLNIPENIRNHIKTNVNI